MCAAALLLCSHLVAGAAEAQSAAPTEQMNFSARAPHPFMATIGSQWVIFANGVIDDNAADRLSEIIRRNNIPEKASLYLNSPGGSLIGGLKLGRAIRAAGLMTDVGREKVGGNHMYVETDPAECYSACALAFLGGPYRFMARGSLYGVHRFSSTAKGEHDLDTAQLLSAVIVEYLREMGINTRYFDEMAGTGSGDINLLAREKLIALGVINNGETETRWTIESVDPYIYIKGERQTWHGINKFIIACGTERFIGLDVIFDPENRESEIEHAPVVNLLIDGNEVSLDGYHLSGPVLHNGWTNATYRLDDRLIFAIQHAHTVGIAYKASKESGMFLGFDRMDFSGGAQKLPGFLKVCRK